MQFDIRVTVREVNNDFQRVADFDYGVLGHKNVLAYIMTDLGFAIEDRRTYLDARRFEYTIAKFKEVK